MTEVQASRPPASRAVEVPALERLMLTSEWFSQADDPGSGVSRKFALEQVVLINMSVALSIALRYRNRGIALEDLEQTACLALVMAAQRFDPLQSRDFLTFAVPTITGEVKKHFRDLGWMVRPPRRIQELQPLVEREQERMNTSDQGAQVTETIAKRLGASQESVGETFQAHGCFAVISLDKPAGEDATSVLGDLIVGQSHGVQDAAEARVTLAPALRGLRAQDRRILQLRFANGLTQQEIAGILGVTQTQVSRLLVRILAQLRVVLTEDNARRERPTSRPGRGLP